MTGDFFDSSGFMPHLHCYLARPALVWTMFASDMLIGLAYVGITLTLWALVRRTRIAFSLVVMCFGAFIGACGLTHFMEVWTLWHPDYWIAAAIKGVTAIASVGTGIYLFRLRGTLAELAEISKISETRKVELAGLNDRLEREVAARISEAEESERKFTELAENLKGHVFHIMEFDPPRISYVSAAFESVWGLPRSVLKEDPRVFLSAVHPEDRARVEAAMEAQLRGEETKLIYRVVRPDGTLRWVEDRAQIVFNSSGRPIRATGYAEDITERKHAEERFERTAKATGLGIWYCDLPFSELIWDKTTKYHFWLSPDARVTIEIFYERIHPGDRERTRLAIAESLAHDTPYDIRYRTTNPANDQEFKWIRAIGWTDYDAKRKPIRFDGLTLDITEQRANEQRIRASEAQLKLATEGAQIGVWHLDLQTNRVTVDKTLSEMFGLDPFTDDVSSAIDRTTHPEDAEKVHRSWAKAVADRQPLSLEHRIVRPDGKVLWQFSSGKASYAEDGTPLALSGITMDITSRKKTEEALRKSEEAFRTLANSMPQIVWSSDGERTPESTFLNDRWYEYTGQKRGKENSSSARLTYIDPEDHEKITAAWENAIATRSPFQTEMRIRSKEGESRWFMSRANPLLEANGEIRAWYGTNTDIHEQKRYQNELQEAVKARDEFLSIASHELKTPLTSLKLQTQMIKRQIAKEDPAAYSKERVDQLADQTDKQVNRLTRLVDDMLDIARIRTGNLTLQSEPFDLRDLVKDTVARMHSQFLRAGCGDPKLLLGDAANGVWDRMRLEQVLDNLFTNAIRYGSGKPVEVSVESFPNHVRLSVKDHGIGIAKPAQEKIFERFERAVNANEVSGLGLGLFIIRQIVGAHGGSIRVESDEGQGACFTVDLPLEIPGTMKGSHADARE